MGFILDGLGTEPYDRSYSDRELVRRILSHFRPHARQMTVVAATIVLSSIASILTELPSMKRERLK